MSTGIRTLIVDDDMLTRAGLQAILRSDDAIDVVGEAETGRDGVRLASELVPDIVLMDLRLPDLDGFEATRQILSRAEGPSPRVIILTTFESENNLSRSRRAGASGFLLKRYRAEEIIDGVKAVAAGAVTTTPDQRPEPPAGDAEPQPVGNEGLRRLLTRREVDVLTLIARGRTNQEISRDLGVSIETVRTHVKRVYWKSGVRGRAEAVIAAYANDIAGHGD